jgi:hypothetical protein
MMITIDADLFFLLLISNAALLGIASFSIIRFERRFSNMEEFWASPTGSALVDESNSESQEHLRIAQRLEKRVGELQRTVKVIEIKSPQALPAEERNLPLENAIRMAKLGASIEDLSKNCGLNIGEARLMQRLHGQIPSAVTG